MTEEVKGLRVWSWSPSNRGPSGVLEAGEYAKDPETGHWFAKSPNGHLADLRLHQVIEHEDGTITVAPSIGIGDEFDLEGRPMNNLYHGHLERGVWRSV